MLATNWAVTGGVLPGVSRSATGHPRRSQIAWILVVRPPRETPIAWAFTPVRRAVRFHVGALVDRALRRQQAPEDAAPAPAVSPVVDGRRRTVCGRHVLPASAVLQHVGDAGDHPAIVDPSRSRLVLRQVRLDRRPRLVRQPEQRSRGWRPRPKISAMTDFTTSSPPGYGTVRRWRRRSGGRPTRWSAERTAG